MILLIPVYNKNHSLGIRYYSFFPKVAHHFRGGRIEMKSKASDYVVKDSSGCVQGCQCIRNSGKIPEW